MVVAGFVAPYLLDTTTRFVQVREHLGIPGSHPGHTARRGHTAR